MYPWVTEVGRLLLAGSGTSWFGVVCPAHCTASLPLILSIFCAGFGFGVIAVLAVLTYLLFPWIAPSPSTPESSGPTSSPSERLAAYLHERGWQPRANRSPGRVLAQAGRRPA
jgi:hypothetical protein